MTPLERALCKVDIGLCWEWTAAINPAGYGIAWDGKRTVRAHRLIWEGLVGPIPEGHHIDHLCRNRKCVNPDHLEPVSPGENTRRGFRTKVTHCPQGHEYVGRNLYTNPHTSHRFCRVCRTEKQRVYNAR